MTSALATAVLERSSYSHIRLRLSRRPFAVVSSVEKRNLVLGLILVLLSGQDIVQEQALV